MKISTEKLFPSGLYLASTIHNNIYYKGIADTKRGAIKIVKEKIKK